MIFLLFFAAWVEAEYDTMNDRIIYCDNYDEKLKARRKFENSLLCKANFFVKDIEKVIIGAATFFAICSGFLLLGMIILWSPRIDEKIALYEEENIKIENQIAAVVSDYQEYELGIIKECAPDKAVTMISLYPELKSDILVSKQIETYINNNNTIKALKEEQINQKVVGWWFNFNLW
jgi:hypothetical protein